MMTAGGRSRRHQGWGQTGQKGRPTRYEDPSAFYYPPIEDGREVRSNGPSLSAPSPPPCLHVIPALSIDSGVTIAEKRSPEVILSWSISCTPHPILRGDYTHRPRYPQYFTPAFADVEGFSRYHGTATPHE
ncbi:unnamed protein product [Nezara viridula]|uniref:Uncharacterized protein n=1 Tax=Nezara viridula TaxID=85310 RepID=A0A9P0HEK3_NEZVI|nr:unnamed protein product [Nezara viridula]